MADDKTLDVGIQAAGEAQNDDQQNHTVDDQTPVTQETQRFRQDLHDCLLYTSCYKSDTKKSRSPIKNQQNRTVALLLHSMQPCYNKKYTLKRQSAL